MTRVSVEEAGAQLGRLVKAAREGEEVVLLEDGSPVARLEPLGNGENGLTTEKPRPRFGSARGWMKIADDFDAPLDDFKEYME